MLWKNYALPLLLETVTSLNRMSLNPVRSAEVVCPFRHVTGSRILFLKICILFFNINWNINTPEYVVVQVTTIFLVPGKTTPDKKNPKHSLNAKVFMIIKPKVSGPIQTPNTEYPIF
jgi:hypothetical protein